MKTIQILKSLPSPQSVEARLVVDDDEAVSVWENPVCDADADPRCDFRF